MSEQFDKIKHWYGWNGGDRPVHANTIVDTVDVDGGTWRGEASGADWSHDDRPHDIAAFRITKLYVEPRKPREWWVNLYEDGSSDAYAVVEDAIAAETNARLISGALKIERVHVREVLPEDEA